MVAIKIKDAFLDLDEKTSINITMSNPIFDRDKINRTFSYPFKIPLTAKNKSILNHQDRLDVVSQILDHPATLYIDNVPFESGVLSIKSSTLTQIKASFKNQPFHVLEELGQINIKDLPYDPMNIGYDFRPFLVMDVLVIAGQGYFTAIQINDTVYQVPSGGENDLIDQINADYPGSAEFVAQSFNTFTMMLITEEMPASTTILLDPPSTDPTTTNYFNLVPSDFGVPAGIRSAYSNYLPNVIDNPDTHVFPVIHNPIFFDSEINPEYVKYINYYNTEEEYPKNSDSTFEQKKSEYSLVPYYFVKTVLDAIVQGEYFDSIYSDFNNDSELSQLLIHNNNTLDDFTHPADMVRSVVLDYTGLSNQVNFVNNWKYEWQVGDHLPDMSAQDFIQNIANTFCNYFQSDGKSLSIKHCKDQLKMDPIDWTHKSEPGYSQEFKVEEGYTLDYDRGDDAERLPGQLEKMIIGDGKNKVTSPWYSMLRTRTVPFGIEARLFDVPFLVEEGNSTAYGVSNEASLRLLFYRGMQPDNENNLYPFASHSMTNTLDEEIGELSLDWEGTHGLYENFWKEYLHLMATGKTVEKVLRLSVSDILELKTFENPIRYIRNPKGNIKAIIKRVQVKVNKDGLSLAKVTFVTM